jgi:hypothetical protein
MHFIGKIYLSNCCLTAVNTNVVRKQLLIQMLLGHLPLKDLVLERLFEQMLLENVEQIY